MYRASCLLLSSIFALIIIIMLAECRRYSTLGASDIPDEKWGYVTVRAKAHKFWWLYGADSKQSRSDLPLILWLQGGPGGSGVGFGNFMEIGPLDINLKPRNTTWLTKANLLFIDTPVGTGFSYVDDFSALTTDVSQIADDLLTTFLAILKQIPALKKTPFYIFSESYGGKMAAAFGELLHHSIRDGKIECNLKGVALGGAWISPVDSVLSWGPYLYQFSLLDEKDLKAVMDMALKTVEAVNKGQHVLATRLWAETEFVIQRKTDAVYFYNVLKHRKRPFLVDTDDRVAQLYEQHVSVYKKSSLPEFMDTTIRQKLKIIPQHVRWSNQSRKVFEAHYGDFMKPVINTVGKLISYGYKVVVFQGQLDVICSTPGAEMWIKKLPWSKLENYLATSRKPLYTKTEGLNTQGFLKTYDNFSLYYIFNAGHMVPADNGEMALKMVGLVVD